MLLRFNKETILFGVLLFIFGCSGGDFAPNSLISRDLEEPPFYGLVVTNQTSFPSSNPSPSIYVEGPNQGDTTHIYLDASCTQSYASGVFNEPSTVYNGTLPGDGYFTFYVQFDFADGSPQSNCYETRARYLLDTTPPDASLYAWLLSSPSNGSLVSDNTPIISSTGLTGEEGTTLTVYEGLACGASLTSSSVNSSENVSSTWTYLTGGPDDGLHNYSIRLVDQAGNDSGCYDPTLSYTLDTVAPSITGSTQPADAYYVATNVLNFTVSYDDIVTVAGGTPRLAITIGSNTRYATYTGGTGTTTLSFSYTVSLLDNDGDGIVVANDIELNGSTIRDNALNNADLTFGPLTTTGILVDGGPPNITSVTTSSTGTFRTGQTITFTVLFDESVTISGTSRLEINLASGGPAYAIFSGPATASSFSFVYTVGAGQDDGDGITLVSPLEIVSGTIQDIATNNANLTYTLPNTSSILIDTTAPTITSLTNPGVITTSIQGDVVTVSANYDEAVVVNTGGGTPSLSINLDSGGPEIATYSSGSGTTTLNFQFSVDADDLDTDGVVTAASIVLNGGTLTDAVGNNADLTIDGTADPTDPSNIRIDGVAPVITSLTNPALITHGIGDTLQIIVNYDDNVTVVTGGGTPTLDFTMSDGGGTEAATYVSGTGTSSLVFEYTVVAGDEDTDGIVSAGSLVLNGATIRDTNGNNADLTIDGAADPTDPSNIRVDGVVAQITSLTNPGVIVTHAIGDTLQITVNYDENVTVNTGGGTPSLDFTMSGAGGTESATYASGTGTSAIVFEYTVVAADLDTDGIITAASIALNGGTIQDGGGTDADLTIDGTADPTDPSNIRVDGVAPTITSLTNPGTVITHIIGDTLQITVNYDEAVTVNTGGGTPSLDFTMSGAGGTESSTYASGSGSTAIIFEYTVVAADLDVDGIVTAGAINLNGATIRDTVGNNADLTIDGAASPSSPTNIRVDGVAPTITSLTNPGSVVTHVIGDTLQITVNYDEAVTVATGGGTPSLDFTMSGAGGTESATYASGTGTTAIVFEYTVVAADLDVDGIVTAGAIVLNGGTIQDASGNNSDLTIDGAASPNSATNIRVDGVVPLITSITNPGTVVTHGIGDTLQITVNYDDNVTVATGGGTPSLSFTMSDGGGTEAATYASGSGTSSLVFEYTVVAGDEDTNGIVTAGAIVLNGGTIQDASGNNTDLTIDGTADPTDPSNIRVDGVVALITSVTNPGVVTTYAIGDTLQLTVNYGENVIVNTGGGTPSLDFTMSGAGGTESATYASGTGTSSLVFEYTVVAADLDTDGIVTAGSIVLNGGTIQDGGGTDSDLTIDGTADPTDPSNIHVDGVAPIITSITNPGTVVTHAIGDTLQITVNYFEAVNVNTGGGTPSLDFTMSGAGGTESATYASGSGTTAIVFEYTVVAADLDSDGIVTAGAITLNSGSITDSAGNDADLTIDGAASPSSPTNIRVDGVSPTIASLTNPALITHSIGDTVQITVNYDDNITVNTGGGTPTLDFTMSGAGGTESATYASGTGTSAIVFEYTVVAADLDADGIVTAGAIVLNGGTLSDTNGNNADLTIDGTADPTDPSNIRIDGVAPIITSLTNPGVVVIHGIGDTLQITVNYDDNVIVTTGGGTPSLDFTMSDGGGTEAAAYASGSGTSSLVFEYTVVGADEDTDGIVTAGAIVLNGGTLRDSSGNDADLTIDGTADPTDPSNIHVDGVLPVITSITNPPLVTHAIGDTVQITVNYGEVVNVLTGGGTPSLDFTMSGAGGTESATYASGTGTSSLVFEYTVVAADLDTDGIVTAGAIVLNGGTIRDGGGTDADLTIDGTADPTDPSNIRIDGVAPTVTSLTNPGTVVTHAIGDTLQITVNYDEAVTVNAGGGTPSLDFTMSGAGGTESATYASGTGTSSLVFEYTVVAADLDTDGIVTAGAIVLNGGTIRDGAGTDADLTIDGSADPTDPSNIRVDAVAPTITSLTNPGTAVIHSIGDTLQITVNYNENVTVTTGGGTPTLDFTMSGAGGTESATYASGTGSSSLVFEYTVVAADLDTDGIVTAGAIALNGGTIRDAATNDADLTIDGAASPSSPTNIRVDGVAPTITSLTNPGTVVTHQIGDTLQITVNYDDNVTVNTGGGTPSLDFTMSDAGGTESATYASGSGSSALVFEYTVVVGDEDTDGIVTAAAIVLNGGTLRDTNGNNADLTIDGAASPSSPTNIRVDGIAPLITSITNPSLVTHSIGDIVQITVNYDDTVIVTTGGGTPSLDFTMSGAGGTESATYASGTGSSSLVFEYTVVAADLDVDGIVTAAAIVLNGGTIRDASSTDADLTIDGAADPTDPSNIRIDGVAPTITSLTNPGTVVTHTAGDILSITVNYDDNVTVATGGGTPTLDFTMSGAGGTESATYASGTGSSSLVFEYTVVAADLDVDGIVTAGAIALNGGTIRDAATNDADLTIDGAASPSSPTNIRVDGVAPTITSLTNPGTVVTHQIGDTLQITVNYDDNVTVNTGGGTPSLDFTMSDAGGTESATYASGSGSSALVFEYTVVVGDEDTDGIVTAAAIVLNGGTLRDTNGNNADLTIDGAASPSSPTNIRVDGIAPLITSITNPSLVTHSIGDTVQITVNYDDTVIVTTGGGTPSLDFTMSGAGGTESATYASGTGTTAIVFEYTVVAADLDVDGIVTAAAIVLNGGTIRDASSTDADLTIDGAADPTDPSNIRIDGVAPTITSLTNPGTVVTHTAGDILSITVNYDDNVTVATGGGTPTLDFTMSGAGGTESATYASGTGSSSLVFEYTVVAADLDVDGIVTAGAIALNGGTIRDAATNDADLTIDGAASPSSPTNIRVDGVAPTITSLTNPGTVVTHQIGDTLQITVNYDDNVTVNTGGGTPSLDFTMSGAGGTESATYASGSGSSALVFEYTVVVGDEDTDGIVTAAAIVLNGGTLRDTNGNNADLTIDGAASPSSPTNIRVDGVAPTITSLTNPGSVVTHVIGDTLQITVNYDEAVTVATGGGTPSLDFTMSGAGGTESATYASGTGTTAIVFEYTVVAADLDVDGIVTAGAIALNGGTIQDASGNNADLTIDGAASPSSPTNIRVDGVAPTITSITNPGTAVIHSIGDTLQITVNYNNAVFVTTGGGTPTLDFTMSGAGGTESAIYASGSSSTALVFEYTVVAADLDVDGIVTAAAIVLNGGTIKDGSSIDADLTINGAASPSSPTNIRVDGVIPRVTHIERKDTNPSNSTMVEFDITFSEAVTALDADDFEVDGIEFYDALTIQSGSGTSWVVRITGITINGSIGLDFDNSGNVEDAAGNDAAEAVSMTADESYTINFDEFIPSDYSNLGLWLDSDDDSAVFQNTICTTRAATTDAVGCWKDKSGNSRNATIAAAANQPDRIAAGIDFDGIAHYFDVDLDFLAGVSHHVFIIANTDAYTNFYGAANGSSGNNSLHIGFRNATAFRMNYWSNDWYGAIGGDFNAGSDNITSYWWEKDTDKEIWANGVSQGSAGFAGNVGTMAGGGRISNVVGQGYYGGTIKEMIFYNRDLTDTERETVEGYLACKWGLQGSLDAGHPHKTTCP